MIYVNLIESVKQIKNQVEVIATIENSETSETYLAISDFFLRSQDILPEDEDDLCYYLEDLDLIWEEYTLTQ